MAVLQDTDNFIVSAGDGQADAGTNYRISYADLIAKIQADMPAAGGGGLGNVYRYKGVMLVNMAMGRFFTHGLGVDPGMQQCVYTLEGISGGSYLPITSSFPSQSSAGFGSFEVLHQGGTKSEMIFTANTIELPATPDPGNTMYNWAGTLNIQITHA